MANTSVIKNFENVSELDVRRSIEMSGVLEMVASEMGKARFAQSAMTLLSSPAIASCTQESVIGCLLKAAVFNFQVSAELGQCWAIPRSVKLKGSDGRDLVGGDGKAVWAKQATFQIGYKGWQQLTYRSKAVQSFGFGEVWEKDKFEFKNGTSAFLDHTPTPASAWQNRGKRQAFYATATLESGITLFQVVNAWEAEDIRRLSDTQYDGFGQQKQFSAQPKDIWGKYYAQMVWKSLIKTICTKRVPTSLDIESAIMADDSITIIRDGQSIEVSPSEIYKDIDNQNTLVDESLSQDAIDSIEITKTPDQLKSVYESLKRNLPSSLHGKLLDLSIKHGKDKGFQNKK